MSSEGERQASGTLPNAHSPGVGMDPMNGPEPSQPMPASSRTHRSLPSLLALLFAFVLVLAGLLFIPAGRLDWLQAWLFVFAYTAFGVFYGAWTLTHDPSQLDERMQVGANTKGWDMFILTSYTLLLIGMLILCGLDGGRFHWAPVPLGLQALGWLVSLLAAVLIWWTSSVNTFMSRTVRIQEERGQHVITGGPYALVRHPMYLGLIAFMIGIPLILNSGWALVLAGLIAVLITVRTALEDRTLQQELPGYSEYAQHVRYRLFPWVW
ncbi:MAG: isoprenylcysteine carboxylmethyltransferase family protein [Anaerolineales bacterium]